MDSSRLNELDVQYNCFKQLKAKSENNDFNELQYFINNSSIVIFYLMLFIYQFVLQIFSKY